MAKHLLCHLGMKRKCPKCSSDNSNHSKSGHFVRKSDGKSLQRFICKVCNKSFSVATFQLCYNQKKRRLNPRIFEAFASGVSQRRIAKLLNISRTTVERKFLFIAKECRDKNHSFFLKSDNVSDFQFDDLETFEHSKLKPLSVIMAVENKSRRILGHVVCQMPAKGLLAKPSFKKYGFRSDHRVYAREELFKKIQVKIDPNAKIMSDKNPHYPKVVKKYFPNSTYKTVPGRRGCVTGQGELKEGGFDPLFTLNHTFAMFRANINRLARKTWCTTKKLERLSDHIEIYISYHNSRIIKVSNKTERNAV